MAMIVEPSSEAAANGSPHPGDSPLPGRSTASRMAPSQAAGEPEFWTSAAHKRLRRGGLDADAAWDAFWDKRSRPATVARLVHSLGTPLAWGVDLASLTEECRALVDLADELDRGAAADRFAKGKHQRRLREATSLWLEAARDGDTDVSFGLGCLAAAHVLARTGQHLGAGDGWPLVDFLAATAEEARPWQAAANRSANAALAQQLVAGELPLTLAYLFSEMAPLAALARPARTALTEGLAVLTGDKGLVRAAHLPMYRAMVACWTRCRAIGQHVAKGAWRGAAQEQYESAVRQAVRWTDGSGAPLLSVFTAQPWTADFLAASLRCGGGRGDAAAAGTLLKAAGIAAEVFTCKRKPPRPSVLSETANLALLRADWGPDAATVAIDYSGLSMRLAISTAGRRLFDGVWTASSRVDGQLLKPAGAWDVVCWFADRDVDYVEFRLELEGGPHLERQVLLTRTDGFLLLADHLKNTASANLEHAWQLPLAECVDWRGADETREAMLTADGEAARVLPLALPEWRVDPRMGDLSQVDGAMRLAQQTVARAVACPAFIDFHPRRLAKPCTWRQLTVAEALQVQPPDVAVGYRVQCGRRQWLIYRSQGARGNRTVLGQNTSAEFLAARFLAPSGDVEHLIQVEG